MSTLSVEEFENIVHTGESEDTIQQVIDREEAELAHALGGPLAGERTDTYYPGPNRQGPIYLRRYTDTVDEVLDGSGAITAYRLTVDHGTIERSDMGWQYGSVSVTYTPSDLHRIKRALIELVRDVLVPDRDREAGSARDDRDRVATARRASLVKSLRPGLRHGTITVTYSDRVIPVLPG